jgi:hypothetical protein
MPVVETAFIEGCQDEETLHAGNGWQCAEFLR